jgi:hypothetical protein
MPKHAVASLGQWAASPPVYDLREFGAVGDRRTVHDRVRVCHRGDRREGRGQAHRASWAVAHRVVQPHRASRAGGGTVHQGRGHSREGRQGHGSMERADAVRAEHGDPGRRMSPSMENARSSAEDVADADLRETAGIAGEMRVGRGEMADATAWAWDGWAGIAVVSSDCGRQRQGRLPRGEEALPCTNTVCGRLR